MFASFYSQKTFGCVTIEKILGATLRLSNSIGNIETSQRKFTMSALEQNHMQEAHNIKIKQKKWYKITQMKPFGAEITNIDLNEANLNDKSLISTLRSDIHKYHLVVVRNQGINNNGTLKPAKHVC